MADITDAEAIGFIDNKVRIAADAMLTAYRTAQQLKDYWDANPQLATKIGNSADDDVRDGANPTSGTGDGRLQITGADVHNIINRANELGVGNITRSAAPLWAAGSVDTILAVAVNGGPKF